MPLEAAYLEAKRNNGAPGSDGETFEGIEARGRGEFLRDLAVDLRAGTYPPGRIDEERFPRRGKVRVISIPSIRDRAVQGALRLILEPIFEADFSDSSFGARPGRSAHEAIEKVRTGLRRRRHRVVDVDLSRYFDTIRHDRMLGKVARQVSDGQVLTMVKQFLKSTGDQGVPQGSPLSPLLANLALNDLDHLLDRGSGVITYARYLDDMVVLAPDSDKGKAWADRALARIRLEADAIGVSLNTEKTRIVTITDEHAVFAFLGFVYYLRSFAWGPLVAAAAITGSLLVSYTRARGESVGVLCKEGLMQRAERLVLTFFVCLLDAPITAATGRSSGTAVLGVLALIAVGTFVTAVQRTWWISARLREKGRAGR